MFFTLSLANDTYFQNIVYILVYLFLFLIIINYYSHSHTLIFNLLSSQCSALEPRCEGEQLQNQQAETKH